MELSSQVKKYGRRIILVTGKGSFNASGIAEKVLNDLETNNIIFSLFSVPGEPSPDLIDKAVRTFSREGIDLIVSIGGGSALDAGKALSAMMNKEDSIEDYLEGVGHKEHPGTKLPFIAVPTTSGTGSEATKNAVISRVGEKGYKKSLRHDNFIPDLALIDPELSLNCPQEITARCGMDCFTQLTEAFLSVKSSQYTDALAVEGLRAIKVSLKQSYLNGNDVGARSGMSFAALTSGICLANAGLGAVHGFASSAGGLFNIPHGLICGRLMAKSNEINIRELRKNRNAEALRKYLFLGELFLDKKGKTDDYYIDGFIQYLYELNDFMKLPGLGTFGIQEKDLGLICSETEIKNNPVALSSEDLYEILYSVIK